MEDVKSFQAPASVLTRVDRLTSCSATWRSSVAAGGGGAASGRIRSDRTSTASSSSGASTGAVVTSGGGKSSVRSSQIRSLLDRERCCPITEVVVETQLKGNLIDRVDDLELRLLILEGESMREKERGERREEREQRRSEEEEGKRVQEACEVLCQRIFSPVNL